MYCVCLWDEDTERVCRFYWLSTMRRALRLQQVYERFTGKPAFIEGERGSYNLDNACGY